MMDADSHDSIKRSGTVLTAVAHIINGVIGSGVLSLAWCVAQMGWIAGPICILVFGIISIISSNLLCDSYRYPHSETGHIRHRFYAKAVGSYLGKKSMWVVGIFIYESFYGFAIAYTITAAISMRLFSVLRGAKGASHSYYPFQFANGHLLIILLVIIKNCDQFGEPTYFMLLYGAVQLVLAQIPEFHDTVFLSIIAAVMSFAYASIGFGLGLAKTIGNGEIKGDIYGVHTSTPQKLFLTFQAIGDVAFSYSYNIIILDIQDTLKGPRENRKMKTAVNIGISITSLFFICCGCFGYSAFGNVAPGNLLTGFGFYEPYWLVDFANACIVVHLMGGYPIYSHPLFAIVEAKLRKAHPNSNFMNKEYVGKLPLFPQFRVNLLRLCFRSAYVASTTMFAVLFPYFNEVLGVIGAFNFWPIMVYFPIQMYYKQKEVRPWTPVWIFLEAIKVFCLLCSIAAFVGSLEGLIRSRFG